MRLPFLVHAPQLRVEVVEGLAVVEVVVVGWEAEARDAVACVELQPHVVRMVERDLEWVDTLVAQHLPTLAVQAVSQVQEVVESVEGGDPSRLAKVEEEVAHATLVVEPREVRAAEHLQVAAYLLFRGGAVVVVVPVSVVVAEQPSGVAPQAFRPEGGDLGIGERSELYVSNSGVGTEHGAGPFARSNTCLGLGEDEVLAGQIRYLPEELADLLPFRPSTQGNAEQREGVVRGKPSERLDAVPDLEG